MSENHRNEGIRLLQKAGGAMHPGTDLATAAEHFYKSHAETTDPEAKAIDIAHCGICFWFDVLAFFRLGAKTNIGSCKSGAPEELFLTMTLKPAEYPGGVIGSKLRSAVSPASMKQLNRCLEAAQFCFRRAIELGRPGLGILWQVALYRGTGCYVECTAAAATASKLEMSADDRKDIENYARTFAGYESDFNWLATAPCNSIIASDKWVQPEILECMNQVCALIEKDPGFLSAKSGNRNNLSTSPAPVIEAGQKQGQKDDEQESGTRARRRKANLCELCGRPIGFFARLFGKTSHAECHDFQKKDLAGDLPKAPADPLKSLADKIAKGGATKVLSRGRNEEIDARQFAKMYLLWRESTTPRPDVYLLESVEPRDDDHYLVVLNGSLQEMMHQEEAWMDDARIPRVLSFMRSITLTDEEKRKKENETRAKGDDEYTNFRRYGFTRTLLDPRPKDQKFFANLVTQLREGKYRLIPQSLSTSLTDPPRTTAV